MITTLRTLTLLLFLSLPLAIVAQTSKQDVLVEQVLTQTNVEESLSQTVSSLKDQIKSNPLQLSESQVDTLLIHFDASFASPKLMQRIKQYFQEQKVSDLAPSAAEQLTKDHIQQVLNAQEYYYTLQGSRERIVRKYEIEHDSISGQRNKLLTSIIDTTSAVESAVKERSIIFRAIISTFGSLSNRSFSESQIDGIVQNFRMQMRPQVERELKDKLAVMYYEVDNKALADYQSFYETEAGQWLSSTIADARQTALQAAADQFVESINGTD